MTGSCSRAAQTALANEWWSSRVIVRSELAVTAGRTQLFQCAQQFRMNLRRPSRHSSCMERRYDALAMILGCAMPLLRALVWRLGDGAVVIWGHITYIHIRGDKVTGAGAKEMAARGGWPTMTAFPARPEPLLHEEPHGVPRL